MFAGLAINSQDFGARLTSFKSHTRYSTFTILKFHVVMPFILTMYDSIYMDDVMIGGLF